MQVVISVVLAAIAISAGFLAAWTKLRSEDKGDRTLGWLAVAAIALTTIIKTGQEINTKHKSDLADLYHSELLPAVDEASGAAALGDRLYVVDDDRSYLYVFAIDAITQLPTLQPSKPLMPCAGTKLQPELLKDGHLSVTDMEGMAEYHGRLYIATSHSSVGRKPEPRRELFLEVEFPSGSPCVKRHTSLSGMLHRIPEFAKELGGVVAGSEKDINVEAVAIAPDGKLYFGLRSPVLNIGGQLHSIVLVSTVKDAFSSEQGATATVRALGWGDREETGITDMAFDRKAGLLVILTNSVRSIDVKPGRAWRWTDNDRKVQTPIKTAWSYPLPLGADAKPEALVLLDDAVFVFLDAQRHGGVRRFTRAEFGLAP